MRQSLAEDEQQSRAINSAFERFSWSTDFSREKETELGQTGWGMGDLVRGILRRLRGCDTLRDFRYDGRIETATPYMETGA